MVCRNGAPAWQRWEAGGQQQTKGFGAEQGAQDHCHAWGRNEAGTRLQAASCRGAGRAARAAGRRQTNRLPSARRWVRRRSHASRRGGAGQAPPGGAGRRSAHRVWLGARQVEGVAHAHGSVPKRPNHRDASNVLLPEPWEWSAGAAGAAPGREKAKLRHGRARAQASSPTNAARARWPAAALRRAAAARERAVARARHARLGSQSPQLPPMTTRMPRPLASEPLGSSAREQQGAGGAGRAGVRCVRTSRLAQDGGRRAHCGGRPRIAAGRVARRARDQLAISPHGIHTRGDVNHERRKVLGHRPPDCYDRFSFVDAPTVRVAVWAGRRRPGMCGREWPGARLQRACECSCPG